MALRELNIKIGANAQALDKELTRIGRRLAAFSKQMQQIGSDLTQSLSLPLAGVSAGALTAFAGMERLEKGLTAVMGSSEAAAVELEKLKKSAQLPGLGFEEAVKGSIRLQAVGFSADEARKTLETFGTAIAATGGNAQNLDSVQYQLTQMISKNRILQQDFGIIQENVPLIGKAITAAFGTNNLDKIRATGISAKEFSDRITDALAKLPELQDVTGGLGNAYDNFRDSVKFSAAELGKSISTALNLTKVLGDVGNALASATEWFSMLDQETQKNIVVFGLILAAIGPVVLIIGKLVSVVSLAIAGFKAFLSFGVSLANGVAGLAAGIGTAVKAFQALSIVMKATVIGAAIGVVLALAAAWSAFTTEVSAAKSAQIAVNDANIQAAKSIAAERLEAEQLTDILKDENQSRKEKEVALKKLKSINADYFGDLTIEKSKVEDITGALNKYNEQLLARARITATTNKLIEVEQKLLDTQQQFEDADPTIFQTVANFVTSGGRAYAFAAKQAGDFTENLNENTGKLTAQKAALEAQLKSLTGEAGGIAAVGKAYEDAEVKAKKFRVEKEKQLAKDIFTPQILSGQEQQNASIGVAVDNSRLTVLQQQINDLNKKGFPQFADSLKRISQQNIVAPETNIFLRSLGEELALIQERTDLTGNSFQGIKDKITAVQEALALGLANGEAQTSIEFLQEQLLVLQESFAATYNGALLVQSALSAGLGAFTANVTEGITGVKDLARAVLQAGGIIIKTLIQEGVTGIVSNILKGPTGKALGPLALGVAAAAGALAAGLFTGLISKIKAPKLATGGLAYGETLATVGDNPNASIDPEVIAPLSKLKSILGDGGGGTLEARISGNDLLILLNRAQFNNRRTNG